jgi:hypothetical protein
VDWQSKYWQKDEALLKKDEALLTTLQDMRKKDEELRILHAKAVEFAELRSKNLILQRSNLDAAGIINFRQMIDYVFGEVIGDKEKSNIIDYFRGSPTLLARYMEEDIVLKGISKSQQENAFGDTIGVQFHALYDRIHNFVHSELSPDRWRSLTGDLEIELTPGMYNFTDKELLLIYHFLDVNQYPVKRPSLPLPKKPLPKKKKSSTPRPATATTAPPLPPPKPDASKKRPSPSKIPPPPPLEPGRLNTQRTPVAENTQNTQLTALPRTP